MSKLFIHIGLHKTGTSFLQDYVFPNISDIDYLKKPVRRMEGIHPAKIKNCLICKKRLDKHQMTQTVHENCLSEAWNIDIHRTTLISDEGLSRSMPHNKNRMELVETLHRNFPDAHIILGIREKKSWLESCYAQYVKAGGSLRFNEYLRRYDYIPPGEYADIIRSMWENVLVFHHMDLKNDCDKAIQNICCYMGVQVPAFELRSVNVSPKGWKLEFWRIINKAFMGEALRSRIESPYRIMTGPIFHITKNNPPKKKKRCA